MGVINRLFMYPNRSPRGLIYHPQTKVWIIQSRCQTRWQRPSKPDPSDLQRSSRWCPAITRLEACSRSTSHHLDSSDLPGHGNTGDRCSGAGKFWWQIATAGCYGWTLRVMTMMMRTHVFMYELVQKCLSGKLLWWHWHLVLIPTSA